MGYGVILFGADLKLDFAFLCHFLGLLFWGMKHECWQNLVCANNGIHSLDKFYADCESLFWQCGCSQDDLCGAVSDNGVCAVDLARVVARHRSDTWCQQQQVVRNGLRHTVNRSTLADGNEHRDWRIWADLAALLIRRARKLYQHDELGLELQNTVYALDATTIDLCLSLFDWAPFRSTKAAIKLHTLLDLRGAIPAFIHISDGKMHEVNVLDFLPLEAGAFYVMDQGYLDFTRLYKMHQAGAFFVTRAKSNLRFRRIYSAPVNQDLGIICDQTIILKGFYKTKEFPEHLRRIRYKEPDTGKTLMFQTNNTALPATTIAALYNSRCQVELFF